MVQSPNRRVVLPDAHHVTRYCRGRDLRPDGRPLRDAFLLRPGEPYLSTNWLEYFHDSDRQSQIAGVRQALADKNFRVSRTGAFAVLNVGAAVSACKAGLNRQIEIIALGEAHDPSHTGIFGYTEYDPDIATRLATSVNINEIYPTVP